MSETHLVDPATLCAGDYVHVLPHRRMEEDSFYARVCRIAPAYDEVLFIFLRRRDGQPIMCPTVRETYVFESATAHEAKLWPLWTGDVTIRRPDGTTKTSWFGVNAADQAMAIATITKADPFAPEIVRSVDYIELFDSDPDAHEAVAGRA